MYFSIAAFLIQDLQEIIFSFDFFDFLFGLFVVVFFFYKLHIFYVAESKTDDALCNCY